MPVSIEQSETHSTIRLEGTVDIAAAAELKQLLLQACAPAAPVALSTVSSGHARSDSVSSDSVSSGSVTISVADLTEIDVTVVQLLWAAEREAQSRGLSFSFAGPLRESLHTALLDAGFRDFPLLADCSEGYGRS